LSLDHASRSSFGRAQVDDVIVTVRVKHEGITVKLGMSKQGLVVPPKPDGRAMNRRALPRHQNGYVTMGFSVSPEAAGALALVDAIDAKVLPAELGIVQ
jgi:hypothetical protein